MLSFLQLAPASLSVFLVIFLARMLGPINFGLFALAIGISTIVFVLGDVGTSTARFVTPGESAGGPRRLIVGRSGWSSLA